jgi:plastocyanin
MSRFVWVACLTLLTVAPRGEARQDNGKKKSIFCCPRVWYTSETCFCQPGSDCKECRCGGCKGGDKCPCVDELRKGNGSLKGVINHKTVSKFPTVVYIDEVPGKDFEIPRWNVRIDQKNKEFIPRILPVMVGSTIEFINSDGFEHNVNSPDNEKFNLGNWGQNEKRTYQFSRPGVYTLLCSLHPEMVGYAIVVKTPYFSVADAEGKFRIPNVPAGKWKVKVWNERMKPKQTEATFDVTVEEGKEAQVEIKP